MDEFDGDGAWSWERLLAHDESVLDAAWAELMQQHWRATEVPLEHRGTVLDLGINSWVWTARLNTSKLAVIFNHGLGVCLVCKNFLASRATNWQCSPRTCTIRGFSMPFQTRKSGPGQCSNGSSWPWTMMLFDDSMTS